MASCKYCGQEITGEENVIDLIAGLAEVPDDDLDERIAGIDQLLGSPPAIQSRPKPRATWDERVIFTMREQIDALNGEMDDQRGENAALRSELVNREAGWNEQAATVAQELARLMEERDRAQVEMRTYREAFYSLYTALSSIDTDLTYSADTQDEALEIGGTTHPETVRFVRRFADELLNTYQSLFLKTAEARQTLPVPGVPVERSLPKEPPVSQDSN